jgi:hypothetical protein
MGGRRDSCLPCTILSAASHRILKTGRRPGNLHPQTLLRSPVGMEFLKFLKIFYRGVQSGASAISQVWDRTEQI